MSAQLKYDHPQPWAITPGREAPASTAWVRDARLEEVRRALIARMTGLGDSEAARVTMRLRYAADIEALWYLRSDMRSVLAATQGALHADETMAALTALFQGLLPRVLGQPSVPQPR